MRLRHASMPEGTSRPSEMVGTFRTISDGRQITSKCTSDHLRWSEIAIGSGPSSKHIEETQLWKSRYGPRMVRDFHPDHLRWSGTFGPSSKHSSLNSYHPPSIFYLNPTILACTGIQPRGLPCEADRGAGEGGERSVPGPEAAGPAGEG